MSAALGLGALLLAALQGCGTHTCDPKKQVALDLFVTRVHDGNTQVLMRKTHKVLRNAVGAMFRTCPYKDLTCRKWETGPDAKNTNLCEVNTGIDGVLARAWDRAGLETLKSQLGSGKFTEATAKKLQYRRTDKDDTVVSDFEIWAWPLALGHDADSITLPNKFYWANCVGDTVPDTQQVLEGQDASNADEMVRRMEVCKGDVGPIPVASTEDPATGTSTKAEEQTVPQPKVNSGAATTAEEQPVPQLNVNSSAVASMEGPATVTPGPPAGTKVIEVPKAAADGTASTSALQVGPAARQAEFVVPTRGFREHEVDARGALPREQEVHRENTVFQESRRT